MIPSTVILNDQKYVHYINIISDTIANRAKCQLLRSRTPLVTCERYKKIVDSPPTELVNRTVVTLRRVDTLQVWNK